jgi:hypothetical protein
MHEAEQQAMARRKANYGRREGEDEREPTWQQLEAVKMTAWIKPKMAHKRLVGRLTTLRAHLLIALRGEEKVRMTEEDDGRGRKKTKIIAASDLPPKERWSPVCEKSFPFELTMSFVLAPDNPGVPHPLKLQEQHRPFLPLDRPISIETGRQLAAWAGGAKPGPTEAPPVSTPRDESTGRQMTGGKKSPEQIAASLRKQIRESEDVASLKDLWQRSERFRNQIEANGMTKLLQGCQDEYDIRLDALSRSEFALEE